MASRNCQEKADVATDIRLSPLPPGGVVYKYLRQANRGELFELTSDPDEGHDLMSSADNRLDSPTSSRRRNPSALNCFELAPISPTDQLGGSYRPFIINRTVGIERLMSSLAEEDC